MSANNWRLKDAERQPSPHVRVFADAIFFLVNYSTGLKTRGYSPFGLRVFTDAYYSILFYITNDDSPELMVILNLFQDLSAEKDKKRLAVRC